ncbi:hypothetical protein [Paracoccus sp. pheM1]|uniref:hypothetical protein n=1 Tax=Paracoccus sp. pheM1 TaxID=2831675 RepID=UPI001BDB8DD1|nr:hypothetical protein [Paracoccus sp. pheM1]MBT0778068.1 hypothetical protein [Paracoccus sp. pheM1]
MPFIDDVNRLLRDHEGYTGDGQGGVGPLPVGDRSTARRAVWKRDLRDLFITLAQTMGDPSALQDILDELDGKADLANSGAFFTSRAAMVSAGQAALPGSKALAFHPDGDWLVVRGFGASADDPLFPEPGPRWGILMRVPSDAITAALQSALDGKASQTALDDEAQAREAGDTASRDRANHTGTQPMGSVDGLEADLEAKQEAITTTDGIARRADDRSVGVIPFGTPGHPDYTAALVGDDGGQWIAFNEPRGVTEVSTPISVGLNAPIISGESALYLMSIEDEEGYPCAAITRDGVGLGLWAGGEGSSSSSGVDVEGFAAKRAANELPVLNDDDQTYIKSFTADREIYIGAPFRGLNYASGAAGAGVDVGWLPPAGEVNIELAHDNAYIYSSLGFGGTAHNTLTRTPGVYTVVRAFRLGQKIVHQALVGSVLESTTAPIRARSIAFGGQSHIQGGFRQGVVAGLLDGLANTQWRPGNNWMPTPVYWTPHCINGATGETAISSASKPPGSSSYWWHRVDQTDGPALTTWKTRISDAVTAGQPVPEDVIWAQGEGDTESTANGTLSLADLWTDMSALFAEMRAFLIGVGATDPQFYIGMLGRGEGTALKAKAQGYTAVRQIYLRLIAETAWIHYACELYDLPGAFNDIHYGFLGHYTHGYRYSRAIANVREGQNNSLGPQVTSATLEDGGRSVRLTISGTDLRMPSNPAPPWIIPAGGDAQSAPVAVTRVRVDGTDLLVTAAQDLTGCRVIYPSGAVPNPRGDSIVYDLAHSHVQMPGLPLRSFITNPLA